jgi:hypothetical protein
MNFDFGRTLSRAWQITWNNKVLWILGILSALGAHASVNFGNSFPRFPTPTQGSPFPRLDQLFPNQSQTTVIAIGLSIICVVIIVALVVWVLSIIGRGGLIGGIQIADTTEHVSFGQAWAVGLKHFWNVLLIGLLVAIAGLIVGLFFAFPLFALCLWPLRCISFLLIPILGVFTYLAQIAAVTENLSVGEAFNRAWLVVRANLGPVIVLGLLLVFIDTVVGLLVLLPFIIAFLPLFFALSAYLVSLGIANAPQSTAVIGQASTVTAVIAGLCVLVWIPVAIVARGILETWILSVWTVAFRQLSTQTGAAPAPLAPAPLAS